MHEKLPETNAIIVYSFLFYRIVSLISGRLLLFVHIVFRTPDSDYLLKTLTEILQPRSQQTLSIVTGVHSIFLLVNKEDMVWRYSFDVISPMMRRFLHNKYICSLVEYRVL